MDRLAEVPVFNQFRESMEDEMKDDFLEQTAVRRSQGVFTALYYLCLALLVVLVIVAVMSLSSIIGVNQETGGLAINWIALIIAVVMGGLAFLLWRASDNCRVEYDYSFTNGNLDVSKVLNNKRRRYLTALEMKDVIRCGPAAGPAFQKALNEPGVKRHNWFVNREANLYFFLFKRKEVKHLIVLELNQEMIDMIRSKSTYLPQGAWYDADGTQKYGRVS